VEITVVAQDPGIKRRDDGRVLTSKVTVPAEFLLAGPLTCAPIRWPKCNRPRDIFGTCCTVSKPTFAASTLDLLLARPTGPSSVTSSSPGRRQWAWYSPGTGDADRREVEWQVARWIHWYNTDRLPPSIGHLPPIEFEHHHRQARTETPDREVA
jgi:hypothetical protein